MNSYNDYFKSSPHSSLRKEILKKSSVDTPSCSSEEQNSSPHIALAPRHWYFVIITVLFLTILKGIRFPNIWSYCNFLFNYEYGFIKRGLIGELIRQVNNPYLMSYNFFFYFSIIIFFMNIVMLILVIRDFINSQDPVLIGCTGVFASSLAVVFLSHSIGYFDHIGLLITLIIFKINGFYKKLLFLSLSMPFALLIHEAIFIIFYPVIFMILLLSIEAGGRKNQFLTLMAFSGILFIIVVIITSNKLEMFDAYQMYIGLQTKTGHTLRLDAFDVLIRNSKDNFDYVRKYWSYNSRTMELVHSLLVTAPDFLVLTYFTVLILKKAKVGYYIMFLSSLASLSPLLMHFLGLDMHRWNTLIITVSFLMLYTVSTMYKISPIKPSNYIYPVLALVIFLNISSSLPLFDGYYVKQFPFLEHQEYIYNLINGSETFPDVPPK